MQSMESSKREGAGGFAWRRSALRTRTVTLFRTASRPPVASSGVRSLTCSSWTMHEQLLLLQACRCADGFDVEAAAGSVTVTNLKGDKVSNPAMVESRQQAIVLSRLIASRRMPAGEPETRPQRRGASRAPYPAAATVGGPQCVGAAPVGGAPGCYGRGERRDDDRENRKQGHFELS